MPAITAATRKTAIVHLIRQCHADRVGEPVLLTALMAAWTLIGLRGEDLSTGLNEMLDDGSLSLIADHKNPAVALTEQGKAWMDGQGVDPQQRREQEWLLQKIQQRAGSPPPPLAPGQVPRWQIVERRLKLS
jgi:hypothetical protein